MIRRIVLLLALPLLIAFGAVSPAQADSPHFIYASGALNSNGSLTVNFKEAGLGTNQLIHYVLSADATATYVCVNKGGANPSASNKTTVSGPVSATGDRSSGKNGQVTSSLTVSPPAADLGCPKGQTQQLAQVTYQNVTLTDTTNHVAIQVGTGSFSSGCLLPNVRGAC